MIEVSEQPKMVERAYLIGVRQSEDREETIEQLLAELEELVTTLGINVVGQTTVRIREPKAHMFLGRGNAEAVIAEAKALDCDCLVFDIELSPAQQRNWDRASGMCVIDRQEVILDIFHQRAHTREAVLQVELARAEHALPRLKNAWTHLSRQRGGGGVVQRGEGESQIELDSRMVRQRIAKLKRELKAVVRHRDTQRKLRERVPVPTAAIVGYTNAGKSTLLNSLTGAGVAAEDKLFATLDPTTRRLTLPSGQRILLTDTVGFVRRLPHQLVDAFKATLEEAVVADLLVHVIDASNPEAEVHAETTLAVLKGLGAGDKRVLTVYNKVDRIPLEDRPLMRLDRKSEGFGSNGKPDVFYISAATKKGLGPLINQLDDILREQLRVSKYVIPHTRYDVMAQLHSAGAVRHLRVEEDGIHVVGSVPPRLMSLVSEYETD